MDESTSERTLPTPQERAAMRARAELARAGARDLIQRCVTLHQKYEQQYARHQEQLAVSATLRGQLRGTITDYASALRMLEVAPESAIVLVKELIDPMVRTTTEVLELRRDIVTWAIEGYYAA